MRPLMSYAMAHMTIPLPKQRFIQGHIYILLPHLSPDWPTVYSDKDFIITTLNNNLSFYFPRHTSQNVAVKRKILG